MNHEQILAKTDAHVRGIFEGEGSGHDWWHIHRVRNLALHIADEEGANLFVTELIALLHDIADWKFNGGDEKAGGRAAREWLASVEADEVTIAAVCEAIDALSYKGAAEAEQMPSLEGKCAQDADRLDAIGAIGIARTFAYGGHKGRPIYDPRIPHEANQDKEAYKKSVGPTINHFYEKLLLLKDRMQTATGRAMAARRHAYMERFLEEFYQEWDGNV